MDPSLTRTGVIATILSFIFAAAAFYVQHRKNSGSNGGIFKNKNETPHVSTTRSGLAKEQKRQSKDVQDAPAEEETVDDSPNSVSRPIFKKYTTSGTQEEHPGLNDDDEAIWE